MPPPRGPGVPFSSDYLPLLLARAAAAVSGKGRPPHRLDATEPVGRVLAVLCDVPDATVGHLAETCYMLQPTMTKLLNEMERNGLLQRHRDARDMRVVRIALTSKGETEAADLLLAARRHEAKLLAQHPRARAIKDVLRDLLREGTRHPEQ